MEKLNGLVQEIHDILEQEACRPFPYKDFTRLQDDFEDMFKKYAPDEAITADFNTYLMFVVGTASRDIVQYFSDPLERYNAKKWLLKSFFDWFPKYRFLEIYDLSRYVMLDLDIQLTDELRKKLLEVISLLESG